jgi:hypothetical protein
MEGQVVRQSKPKAQLRRRASAGKKEKKKKTTKSGMRRRSTRVAGGAAANDGSVVDSMGDGTFRASRSVGVGEGAADDGGDDGDEQSTAPRRRRTTVNKAQPLSAEVRVQLNPQSVRDAGATWPSMVANELLLPQNLSLIDAGYDASHWLVDFTRWLQRGDAVTKRSSKANVRNVLKQTIKLVRGDGITYHYYTEGVVFKGGESIGLTTHDMVKLWEDAGEHVYANGKDRSNGWTFLRAS